ncbi:peptide chain release factor N(5)-glutamine methyltransferase [Candidatus Uhrbacteria bacterium]|nr:peptide chain release factor N(5)-glutamine methyltransferase [Candidatus Uhrbacteria bacterium]
MCMTISVALFEAAQKLQPKRIVCQADRDLGRLEAEILLAHILGKDRAWLLAHGEELLRPNFRKKFQAFVDRRVNHEPIAYILGYREFYGRNFKVTRDTLIPRPETELMVDLILQSTRYEERGTPAPLILDLGTGSGALAVTLAKEIPSTTVLATDISPRALQVARSNARQLGSKNIKFLQANLLDPKVRKHLKNASKKHPTLIIAANLPYLPNSDKKILDPDVVSYEPSKALFAGQDGLGLIRKFLVQLAHHFGSLGFNSIRAYLEFDPPQSASLKNLAQSLFPKAKIKIHKDLAKRNRVLEIIPTP